MPGKYCCVVRWMLQVLFVLVVAFVTGQQLGTQQAENHPSLTIQSCSTNGGCRDETKSVMIDANWQTVYSILGPENIVSYLIASGTPVCAQMVLRVLRIVHWMVLTMKSIMASRRLVCP